LNSFIRTSWNAGLFLVKQKEDDLKIIMFFYKSQLSYSTVYNIFVRNIMQIGGIKMYTCYN